MLQKYTESDFEGEFLDKSRLILVKKVFEEKSPFFFNFKLCPEFYFVFCNIVNIDIFLIHRFLLVFWLFTGGYGTILKLKINLRLGINYYHFILKYVMKKRKFFFILSFLLDEFLNNQFWDSSKFINTSYVLFFKNLEILTNYKLARGVYFHRIQQKFYLKLDFENKSFSLFKFFLTNIKLYVI